MKIIEILENLTSSVLENYGINGIKEIVVSKEMAQRFSSDHFLRMEPIPLNLFLQDKGRHTIYCMNGPVDISWDDTAVKKAEILRKINSLQKEYDELCSKNEN